MVNRGEVEFDADFEFAEKQRRYASAGRPLCQSHNIEATACKDYEWNRCVWFIPPRILSAVLIPLCSATNRFTEAVTKPSINQL